MISSAITSLYFLGRMDSNEGEIMEKEQAVLVALHIRPLIASERMQGCKDCIAVIPGEPQVLIGSHRFTFDRVYGSTASPSGEIFEECVAPLVDSFFQGYNGTVLAYGQTGSGKTYTMGTGFTVGEWKEGIIPKVMQSIFLKIESLPNREEYNLKVSFIQILKEEVQDLLDSNSAPPGKQNLQIRETASGEITLAGVTEIDVFSLQEMASCLEQGSIYRATGSTNMNSCSSRSHAIFTISLERKRQWDISSVCGMFPSPKDGEDLLYAKLHLVDLAGSERAKRTGTDGLRFKEGVHINRGLLSLGNVISALGDDRKKKEGGHIPYRDSKLTRLLQDSLGGNSRTVMIACVSPADFNAEETLNTLKYANRARNIQNKPIVNHNPLTKEMLQMKQRLEFLQEELVCARISDASSVNWQAMKQKLEWLETKNAKLREELMKCQEELQIVSQQVLDTQIERDMLRLKLEEISTSNGVNYDEIEDVQETSLLKTYLTKIQEQDSELQQLCSIGSRVVDSSSLDNLCASLNKCQICVDAEAVAKEWKNAWLQYTHGEVLQELNAQLEQEEAEMKTFARSDIVMQKQHFGETNAILEAQKISLQTGRDHLMTELDSLVTTSNDKTQKIHKARMQELKQVEMQLLKEGCTAEIGMQKVKVLNLHQKMILERKTEEAATVTCHLKELLKTQKSLPKEWAEASLSNGAEGQNAEGSIQNWLDHELKVAVGIYQLRSAYEKQSDSRAAMARELGKLKDAEPQSALFLPKILSQDYPSQSITNQISSKPPSMQSLRLNFLQSMLDESSNALVDMASQLSDAEEHERTFNASARWQDVHTLGEAKNLLQLVFGAATAARCQLHDKEQENKELKDEIIELKDLLRETENHSKEVEVKHCLREQAVALALVTATKGSTDMVVKNKAEEISKELNSFSGSSSVKVESSDICSEFSVSSSYPYNYCKVAPTAEETTERQTKKIWRWKRNHRWWMLQFKWMWRRPWRLSEWIRHGDESVSRIRSSERMAMLQGT